MKYKGYLIDLDGTMFRGEEIIDGAREFIDSLHHKTIPYVFITNNSTYSKEMILNKLNRLGIRASEQHILTSAMATAKMIKKSRKQARCFVIGEEGLARALKDENMILTDYECDYVIVGLDRQISYDKLAKACLLIRGGAQFIITNKDAAIPTEHGLLPGNGAIASTIEVSTGIKPVCVGKPEPIIMGEAVKMLGVPRQDVLMIGDNYETDITAGLKANMDTLMVLTGYSTVDDLKYVKNQPTYVRNNLKEWKI